MIHKHGCQPVNKTNNSLIGQIVDVKEVKRIIAAVCTSSLLKPGIGTAGCQCLFDMSSLKNGHERSLADVAMLVDGSEKAGSWKPSGTAISV